MKIAFRYIIILTMGAIITGIGILSLSKLAKKPVYKPRSLDKSQIETIQAFEPVHDLHDFLDSIPQEPKSKSMEKKIPAPDSYEWAWPKRSPDISTTPKPAIPTWPDLPIDWHKITITKGNYPIQTSVPNMPSNASRSGHCKFKAHVNTKGQVDKIIELACSDSIFESETRRSAKKWIFKPVIKDGKAILFTSEEQIVKYDLLDESGNKTPE